MRAEAAAIFGRPPSARNVLQLALMGLALLVLLACTTQFRNHGYVPPEEDLALLDVGRDTRDTVAATIGRPSTAGLLNDVGWYYVQSHYEIVGGMAPNEIDRQVVAITFTLDGVVENIERYGLADGQMVAISRRVTTSNVKSQGFLRQLFGNIGSINTGNLFGQ
jgi:outer membrane protein assembly factor BamE (lipoprotein component of BamABCDE complex)